MIFVCLFAIFTYISSTSASDVLIRKIDFIIPHVLSEKKFFVEILNDIFHKMSTLRYFLSESKKTLILFIYSKVHFFSFF